MACISIPGSFLPLPSLTVTNTFLSNSNTIFNHSTGKSSVLYPSTSSNRKGRGCSKTRASAFSTRDLRPELDDYPEGIISGEWPENFSLLSYDDLRAYLESQTVTNKIRSSALLKEVMSTTIQVATPEQTLEEIDHHFEVVSGLPVVDGALRCIGVISRKDRARAPLGSRTKVAEVMSSPAITLSPDKTVSEAAALMLKMKIHRIPIVNEQRKIIGIIVTRTDLLHALESLEL